MSYQTRQVRRNIRKHVLQLIFTGTVIGCFLATLRIFRAIGDFSPRQKTAYSGISTALILILGLNFFNAVKNLAEVSPELILDQRRYRFSDDERELIVHLEKWSNVLRLISISFSRSYFRPLIGICCIAWVLFFLSGQTALALINVIITVNDGTNYTHIYTRYGNVSVANLSCYFHYNGEARNYTCPQYDDLADQETVQALAHAYGESARGSLSQNSNCGNYTEVSDILASKVDYKYYCRRTPGREEFAYRFSEYNPDDKQNTYPSFTNRTITASSGLCLEYSETNVTSVIIDGISGRNHSYVNESGFEGSIFIPLENDIFDSTTYIWRGDKKPQNATFWQCGPRCLWMWAHKSASPYKFPTDPKPAFFQCPISVSHVNNASNGGNLDVPDGIARIAASAIALQGRTHGSPPSWSQWQFYAAGSAWETHFHNASKVGANMAEFAIGSISTMVLQNPRINITGEVPYLSSYLGFTWSFVFALLASVFGAHLLIFILIIYISWYSSGTYNHLHSQQGTSTQPLINITSNQDDQSGRPKGESGEHLPPS